MGLSKVEFNQIFEMLEARRPKITLVNGINNKSTYFQSDVLYKVLKQFCDKLTDQTRR